MIWLTDGIGLGSIDNVRIDPRAQSNEMEKESSDKAEHSKDAIRCNWGLGGLLRLQFVDKQGRP